jgi:hypothetical protein
MKFFPAAILLLSAFAFSCGNNHTPATSAVSIGSLDLKQKDGKDCDQPDTLRTNCAEINLSWPVVKTGSESLKKSVADWSTEFLVGMLAPATDSPAVKITTLDKAVHSFFDMHCEWTKEEGLDSPLGYYIAECRDSVLLNDGKHLTLTISGYTYTGGAHESPMAAVRTFDINTGKPLTWSDLVTDTAAVRKMAEQHFRAERADIFEPDPDGSPSFNFDDIFTFQLPVNYGLTDKGLYFLYMHYEVTPYAYGSTEFVIPFGELGALLKK